MNVTELTLALCQIPSTTGEEQALVAYLTDLLRDDGYQVRLQPIEKSPPPPLLQRGENFPPLAKGGQGGFSPSNLLAFKNPPKILLTTHLDTVPPYFPPSLENGILKGRGVCDAKGIMAAMICAARYLKDVGLLFLVSEETNSEGAKAAAQGFAPKVSYFINGEPTDLKIASAMKGALAFTLTTKGKTGHSAYPETGHSAVHQLLHDLHTLLHHTWPDNSNFGKTTLNIGRLEGGCAANVIADHARAHCVMRTTIEHSLLEKEIRSLIHASTDMQVLTASSPILFEPISGFETCIVKFASDVPYLKSIGTPILLGPGSILHAHTAEEQISVKELEQAVGIYEKLCQQLLGNKS